MREQYGSGMLNVFECHGIKIRTKDFIFKNKSQKNCQIKYFLKNIQKNTQK